MMDRSRRGSALTCSLAAAATCAACAACAASTLRPDPRPAPASNRAPIVDRTAAPKADPSTHAVPTVEAASPPPRPRAAIERWTYEGTIAGAPVIVRIACRAHECDGAYFYTTVGGSLRLVGTAALGFDERVGAPSRGRVTGHLTFDGPPGGETWSGTWTRAGRTTPSARPTAPIRLTRGRTGAPRWYRRTLRERSVVDPDCKVEVTSFEVAGLADAELEARVNEVFAPEHLAEQIEDPGAASPDPDDGDCGEGRRRCDDTANGWRILCRALDGARSGLYFVADVAPTVLDRGILSVRKEYGFDGGGIHPSDGVEGITIELARGRVLGPADLLADPEHPPDWAQLIGPSYFQQLDPSVPATDLEFGLDDPAGRTRASVHDAELAWTDFYLTPRGLALVPRVGEAIRVFRHQVPVIPDAKIPGGLLRGPFRTVRPRSPR